MEQPRYLILENGQVFRGRPFGKSGQVIAEIVFTTAMTGYLETLTDPSYHGQMVVQAFPLIGNYGVIPADFEAENPALQAYIVRDWCQVPSNFRSEEDLDTFLLSKGIVGLWDIDTRALVKIIRDHGVMNALITDDPEPDEATLAQLSGYLLTNAVSAVSRAEAETLRAERAQRHVVLWDFGAKRNIANELLLRGCDVTIVPAGTPCDEILAYKPDGIMLSNGPGDPAENTAVIEQLQLLCEANVPIFGICLGAPAARAGTRRRDDEAQIRPSRREPTRSGACDKEGIYHKPEPWICGEDRRRLAEARACELSKSQRRHLRRYGIPRHSRIIRTVSS